MEFLGAVAERGLRRVRWAGVMQEMATAARKSVMQRTRTRQKAEAIEKQKRENKARHELFWKGLQALGPSTGADYLRKREELERVQLRLFAESERRRKRREARVRAADRKWGATSDIFGRPLWSVSGDAGGSGAQPAGRGRGQGRGAGNQLTRLLKESTGSGGHLLGAACLQRWWKERCQRNEVCR